MNIPLLYPSMRRNQVLLLLDTSVNILRVLRDPRINQARASKVVRVLIVKNKIRARMRKVARLRVLKIVRVLLVNQTRVRVSKIARILLVARLN